MDDLRASGGRSVRHSNLVHLASLGAAEQMR
jgi:hypothetical protein